MSTELSNLIVKGTLGALVLFSALTWTIAIAKLVQHLRIGRQNARFLSDLQRKSGLPSAAELARSVGAFARVAAAGAGAWQETAKVRTDIEVRRDLLERSLRKQVQRERRAAEAGLAVLASIGTTSPFIGLFGTVWGIVGALRRISSLGSASLEVVAGPIGEALIATAVGIAAAVPALLVYNYFVRRLKLYTADLDDFSNSVVNTAVRGSYLGLDIASDREPTSEGRASRSVATGSLQGASV